jgi:hypothetical protein
VNLDVDKIMAPWVAPAPSDIPEAIREPRLLFNYDHKQRTPFVPPRDYIRILYSDDEQEVSDLIQPINAKPDSKAAAAASAAAAAKARRRRRSSSSKKKASSSSYERLQLQKNKQRHEVQTPGVPSAAVRARRAAYKLRYLKLRQKYLEVKQAYL